jgi:subtilisin family serine protease
VDVYATGNACWAALSNQKPNPGGALFTVAANNRYQFFNGTSSACPVVAGILGTYLTEFPTTSPGDAKKWLTDNSVKGNIAETRETSLPIDTHFNKATNNLQTLTMPFGPSSPGAIADFPHTRVQFSGTETQYNNGEAATLEDFSFCCRFFNSTNLMPQAYPLRKGIFDTSTSTIDRFNTTLRLSADTDLPKTHDLPLF